MSPEVVVIGGGIIGLASAWRLAQDGARVTILDDAPGSGASNVAAGMLAPVTEVAYGEEELLALTIASARRWPSFVDELEAATDGREGSVGYRADGTVLVGATADDMAALRDLLEFQQGLGLDAQPLPRRDCRQREPLLSPRVAGGLLAREDHHVDPRRAVAALRRACGTAGASLRTDRVARIDHDRGAVTGVVLATGERIATGRVVLAAGCWSAQLAQDLPEVSVPVRPVKGQLLVLAGREGVEVPRSTVRGLVRGRSVYLVPRVDGRVVVGATQEERGYDTTVTAGGVRQLLEDAAAIVPGVDELALVETLAGSRPGTPDNRPIIGPCAIDGLLLATGHHRHGVLLAPATADAVAAYARGEQPDPTVIVADPRRPSIAPTDTSRRSA